MWKGSHLKIFYLVRYLQGSILAFANLLKANKFHQKASWISCVLGRGGSAGVENLIICSVLTQDLQSVVTSYVSVAIFNNTCVGSVVTGSRWCYFYVAVSYNMNPWYMHLLQWSLWKYINKFSWHSLSRPCLSRITAYLEVKMLSLLKHENLTTGKKYCGKEEKLVLLFSTIFSIYL